MADRRDRGRDDRPEPFPCPYCHGEVPGDGYFCQSCSKRVVEHCRGCGRRRTLGQGYVACTGCGYVEGAVNPATAGSNVPMKVCSFCRTNMPRGLVACPNCLADTRKLKRLCPKCLKEVDPKANSCQYCGHRFPLSVGKKLNYIVCFSCHKEGMELDDWMADRGLRFLFQSPKGEKVTYFDSKETAARVWQHYFESGSPRLLEAVAEWLSASDEAPWVFSSAERTLEFLSLYKCRKCWSARWRLSKAHATQEMIVAGGRVAVPAMVKFTVAVGKVLRGAGGEARQMTKKGGK